MSSKIFLNKNKINRNIPKYPFRVESKYLPRELDDYNDGGAYPEIHVVQYPLNMGKPGHKSTAIVTVNVDNKGEVCYDAIVKQGQNQNKLVKTSINDLKESEGNKDALAFYKNVGFQIDSSSPSKYNVKVEYELLCLVVA
jgi:SNW domain-containing protein 1